MINNLNDLIKASDHFSMPDGIIESKEKGRLEFLSKFPLASIQNIKADEYCLGTSEDSFCYWLEFKEILFGIGGGNASKFGIYKSKDDIHNIMNNLNLPTPKLMDVAIPINKLGGKKFLLNKIY